MNKERKPRIKVRNAGSGAWGVSALMVLGGRGVLRGSNLQGGPGQSERRPRGDRKVENVTSVFWYNGRTAASSLTVAIGRGCENPGVIPF